MKDYWIVCVDNGADDMTEGETAAVSVNSCSANSEEEAIDIIDDRVCADTMSCFDDEAEAQEFADSLAEENNTNARSY